MNLQAAFRADGSTELGVGHFVRSLTLARAWKNAGGEAVVITGQDIPALIERAGAHGMPVLRLTGRPDDLGLRQTSVWAKQHPGSWVSLDGYQFGEDYQCAVVQAGARCMVIDDYARLPRYHTALMIDQNFGAETRKYPLPPEATALLGPRYALVAPEFQTWRVPGRPAPPVISRILVTLGGADLPNATARVANALLALDLPDLEAVFVIGAANPHGDEIAGLVASRPGLRTVRDARDMPAMMAWADLAITSAGTTSWELCMMGVPSVSIVLAENQRPAAQALSDDGVFLDLGWHENVNATGIVHAVMELSGDCARRQEMAGRGQELVDGLGASRVAREMMAIAERAG